MVIQRGRYKVKMQKIIWIWWGIIGILLLLKKLNMILISNSMIDIFIWILSTLMLIDFGIDAKKENRTNTFILYSIVVPIITIIILVAIVFNKK